MAAAALLLIVAAPLRAQPPVHAAMLAPQGREADAAGRWYSEAQVTRGAEVYARSCAACHGSHAEGGGAGGLQSPPLDGSGHSAHHGLDYLLSHVADGGVPTGGRMPPFGGALDDADRRAAIAWVQSLWPEAVYRSWQRNEDHRLNQGASPPLRGEGT